MNIACTPKNRNLALAGSIFLTQLRHSVYNPNGPEYSENCGPTSLAMAASLLQADIPPIPGLLDLHDSQSRIDAVRFWMFSNAAGHSINPEKDGVEFTPDGVRRAPSEHLTLVNLPDMERGAANLALSSKRLLRWYAVDSALKKGHPVALAGDPSVPGAYGARLKLDYQGGHVILLLTCLEKSYLVNDPLHAGGPCWIHRDELEAFAGPAPFEEALALAFSLA